jgi:hypothetical protein
MLPMDVRRSCGCGRGNEKFFALFSQADSNVFESAAILVEPVIAPHERRALLAKRMHDTEHAGNDATKPNRRCATPGPTCLAGTAFSPCTRVYLPDAVGDKLLRDDWMHGLLLVIPARTAGDARGSIGIEVADRHQEQPEVTYPGQQPVQGQPDRRAGRR